MPWIRGKFYMNPFYGRGVERERECQNDSLNPSDSGSERQRLDSRWVTIDGRHVLIDEASQGTKGQHQAAHHVRLDLATR